MSEINLDADVHEECHNGCTECNAMIDNHDVAYCAQCWEDEANQYKQIINVLLKQQTKYKTIEEVVADVERKKRFAWATKKRKAPCSAAK